MNSSVEINLFNFSLIYALLIIVLLIMKKAKIDQSKLLIFASIKMSIQLILAGLILTYVFKNPNPIFIFIYLTSMIAFAIHRVISQSKQLNSKFKIIIVLSMTLSGLFVLVYFVLIVINKSLFNPQFVIPIAGMIMGNMMTGVSLANKTFFDLISVQKPKINALINFGASPKVILLPFVKQALQTAMLPTINSMVGMGIVSLPGMMTGQILAGTLPTTAILYQIAIMIAICTVVALSCFCCLYFGYQTLFDEKTQIIKL